MAAELRDALQDLQSHTNSCKVTKLNDKNYTRWKKEMMMYLKGANLWSVIVDDLPAAGQRDAAWNRRNDRAWSDIYGACDSDQQEFIIEYEFAKQAWDRLQSLYESHDTAAVQCLYSEWHNLHKVPSEAIPHYIARVKSLARRLTAAGELVSNTNLLNKIIGGLDSSYDSFKMTLCLIPDLNEDRLTRTLMSEESRRQALLTDDNRRHRQNLIRDQSRRVLEDMAADSRRRRSASPDREALHQQKKFPS